MSRINDAPVFKDLDTRCRKFALSASLKYPKTFLLVIDNLSSNYSYWEELNKEDLGTFGIYKIWRLDLKRLEKKETLLRSKGFEPDWNEFKNTLLLTNDTGLFKIHTRIYSIIDVKTWNTDKNT